MALKEQPRLMTCGTKTLHFYSHHRFFFPGFKYKKGSTATVGETVVAICGRKGNLLAAHPPETHEKDWQQRYACSSCRYNLESKEKNEAHKAR